MNVLVLIPDKQIIVPWEEIPILRQAGLTACHIDMRAPKLIPRQVEKIPGIVLRTVDKVGFPLSTRFSLRNF